MTHGLAKKFVSLGILDPVNLTVNINHGLVNIFVKVTETSNENLPPLDWPPGKSVGTFYR